MAKIFGYKVVKKIGRGLYSVLAPSGYLRHVDCVRYKLNQWASPNENCGPLATFLRREDAENFIQTPFGRNGVLYHCEIIPSAEKSMYYIHVESVDGRQKHTMHTNAGFPKGTVLADKVRLIQKVKLKTS